jgi:hypothetical protein
MAVTDHYTCPTCRLGHMDLKLKVYRSSQFDPESIRRIEMLVGQAGPPPNRYQPSQTHAQSRKINRTADAVSEPIKARPESKK